MCYVSCQVDEYCNESEDIYCLDCKSTVTEVGMTSCLSYTIVECDFCSNRFYLGENGLEREDD